MKAMFKILFHPVLLAILGLLALAAIIWFVGPLIAIASWRPLEPDWVRIALIAVAVLLYVGKKLWGLIKAKRTNANMVDGLMRAGPAQPAPGESASAQEVATLRKRFEEALKVLKEARLGTAGKKSALGALSALTSKQYLYQLPWYIFIGPPGSGKTTALLNSGLQFPLAERFGQQAIRGVGGTRNCDWWFTDEAVLLDTAGRYTTQESDREVDRAAWNGFLQLLKKSRPRRPINGVIVTVSVADLLQQSGAELDKQALAVRSRIQELHEQLNIRFPIYVLVTKCDLLAGFMESFGELGREERTQVWGMTFPMQDRDNDPAPLAGFGEEFSLLEQRVYDRLLDTLQQERDPGKRGLIYAFPQQFSSLKELLSGLLDKVFSPSRFEARPMLRGVYFASGTQEGSPIDRVMGTLARAFGLERKLLPPQKASGRSYFLTRLVKEVMFKESGLAGTNLRWERKRALLKWAAYAGILLLTIAVVLAWTLSYTQNKAYVAEVEGKLTTVKKQVEALPVGANTNAAMLLPVLQSVQELAVASGASAKEEPWSMSFGLFQGDKLAAASQSAYRRLLTDAFLPRLAYRIEEQLRTSGRDNPELLYEGLKAYIMLNDPQHFDADALKLWITADWERNLPRDVTVESRRQLEAHLDALLDQGAPASPIVANEQLIEQVRSSLAQLSLAQRVYSRLKRQGVGADLPEFTIAKAAGPSAPLVFVRTSGQPLTKGVPGLFSYNGYHKAFVSEAEKVTRQLAREESWVLGIKDPDRLGRLTDALGGGRLTEDVRRIYLEDYARVWEAFVADIKLIRPGNLEQSIQSARVLSAPDSPLTALLRAIVRETTLTPQEEAAEKTAVEKAADKAKEARDALGKLLGTAAQPAPGLPAGARIESIVDERFESLRRLVKGAAPGQPAPIDASLGLINELYTLLNATDSAVKAGNAPPASDVPNKLKAESARMPEPVRSMMQTLSGAAQGQTSGAVRQNISQNLGATIGDFCVKAVSGRYPFVPSSAQDVTQDDFARLFAPGGTFDEFFKANLAAHVDVSTKPWSFRKGEATLGESSAALIQFQRAATIRDVFFRAGGRTPGLRLEFKPLEMDPSITQFILDVDGQVVKYAHGPQVPASVQWPGPKGTGQVRVQIQPPPASGASGMVFEGPWALFRMFDRVQMEPTPQAERFRATFNIDGRKTQFEVIASSVQNPFRLREIEQFQCPGRL
jgi:type VI secretion system protein ImpL